VSNLAWFFVALAIVLALIAGYAASLIVRRQRLDKRIEQLEKPAH
jgi:CcmD family protein